MGPDPVSVSSSAALVNFGTARMPRAVPMSTGVGNGSAYVQQVDVQIFPRNLCAAAAPANLGSSMPCMGAF